MRHGRLPYLLGRLEAAERFSWGWLLLATRRRHPCSVGVPTAPSPIQAGLDHGTWGMPRP
jgi:hypothetical protein